jgi:dTDP-4-amino-4,6-dideoxygalactose transaminase
MKTIRFDQPIYVTRPTLPPLEAVTSKLQEIWQAQWLTNNGRQHTLLEERLVKELKVPYLSLFNNGTIALMTAVQSLRLSGEVITTPFTFPATPHILMWNGISPIFCDIDPVTMTIDAQKIESMITPQTTGILAVHVYGTPCNVMEIQQIANQYGLRVIYDAAHAFGTEICGVGIGTYGDISMFSFHATKLFHTAEGGALTFNDPHLKRRIDLLKNFGIKNEEEVVMPGINGKMNEIQAALGLVVLDLVDEERRKRHAITDLYRRRLEGIPGITLPTILPHVKDSCQYFVIKIDESAFGHSRDFVYEQFKHHNVFTRKYFYPLCSDYTCYRYLPSSSRENLPIATIISQQVLSLPLYGALTDEQVESICDILISMRK